MRRPSVVLILFFAGAAFFAGWFLRGGAPGGASGEREVLYWVDPMNPEFRSSEPGIAPCGMPLEPVYAGGMPAGGQGDAAAIQVAGDRRQALGIVVETAERAEVTGSLRLLGSVIADERRAHLVVPEAAGRIESIGPATVGSIVRKGDVLASVSSGATENVQWNLMQALDKLDALQRDDPDSSQTQYQERQVASLKRTLLSYGLTAEDIRQVEQTRRPVTGLRLRAPASGFVLVRNAELGEEFNSATPLYVIADLDTVFVLADVTEEDLELLDERPEAVVSVPGRSARLDARARSGPYEFDDVTGSRRIRFEVRNADWPLFPGMSVDLDVNVSTESALTVPADAVIDNGLSRRVYVDGGDGRFTSRDVTVGWRFDGRVEILDGLVEGERVVVSGNFLLDSESRMRTSTVSDLAAEADVDPEDTTTAANIDPICGMKVDPEHAHAVGLVTEHTDGDVLFCSETCKRTYDASREVADATPPEER